MIFLANLDTFRYNMHCDIMKAAKEYLESILKKDDCIVVGVSGGPDSMCLLNILNEYKDKYNLKIIVAHVNHNTRKENEAEKAFVENYANNNNLIFEYYKIPRYKNNKFSEEEGRRYRYEFFKKLINKYQAKYLMTAHHGDDLIETILMRMTRGSNLKGYIGISKATKYQDYILLRPLLYTNKKDILRYLEKENIKYIVDKSNENPLYTRNRYRLEVIPNLEKETPNLNLKFLKFSEELEEYYNYVNEIVIEKYNDIVNNQKIDLEKLKKEKSFIQKKIIEKVISDIQKEDIFDISDKQFKEIMKLVNKNENKKINLHNDYIARISYNNLIIAKNKEKIEYEYTLKDKVKILDKYLIEVIKESQDKSNNIIRLDSKEIELPLKVRNIKDGDKIKIKNLNGTKKIKDILIDNKIDIEKRKEYPLVLDNKNTIIWLPGQKKSIFDKEISEKYDIILKYTEE